MLPVLSYYYAKSDPYGNPVGGHEYRTRAIVSEWVARGGEAKRISAPSGHYDMLLVDTWEYIDNVSGFCISITGTRELSCVNPRIVVSPSLGAEQYPFDGIPVQLLGAKYFVRRKSFDKLVSSAAPYLVDISLIPGGNKREFERQVDWRLVSSGWLHAFARGAMIGLLSEIEGVSPDQFPQRLADANIVITACGNSALEALSMGKSILIVKTADDQEMNYQFLLSAGVKEFSEDNLRDMVDDVIDGTLKPVDIGLDRHGAERIVNEILREWERNEK